MQSAFNRPIVVTTLFVVTIGLIMQIVVSVGLVSELIVPRPFPMILALVEMLQDQEIWNFFLITFASTLTANLIAIIVGLSVSLLLHYKQVWAKATTPMFGALFAAPMILLYPIFLVLFGRTQTTIIAMGALTGFIPIVLNTVVALDAVPKTFRAVAKSYGCSTWQEIIYVVIPGAAAGMFVGIRLGLIYSLVNIIGIEFLINFGGLGYLVSHMYDLFEITKMYAAIVLVISVSVLFYVTLNLIQARINRISLG
jgi:NitT/TauT family transport system permease protein